MSSKKEPLVDTKIALLEAKIDAIHDTLLNVINELKEYNKNLVKNNEIVTKLEIQQGYRDKETKEMATKMNELDKKLLLVDEDVKKMNWNFKLIYGIIAILGSLIGFIIREYISKTFF